MVPNEQVLAFPRQILDDLGVFNGFSFDHSRYMEAIFKPGVLRFVPRESAEKDFTLKQLIPYVLIVSEGKVLFYVRGKKSGETRLQLKGSVGVGGHINPVDEDLFQQGDLRKIYDAAVVREVREEVRVEGVASQKIVGLINDDSSEVGKVHIGVVHLWELKNGKVEKAESVITRLEFLKPEEILSSKDVDVESWSRFCLEKFNELFNVT